MIEEIKRGKIFYIEKMGGYEVGSEQRSGRPAIVVSNDKCNEYSEVLEVVFLTTQPKHDLPTHIDINADRVGLAKDSVILLEQIRTLDKRRLKEKMGHLDSAVMSRVNNALAISCGLGAPTDTYSAAPSVQAGAVASADASAQAIHNTGSN